MRLPELARGLAFHALVDVTTEGKHWVYALGGSEGAEDEKAPFMNVIRLDPLSVDGVRNAHRGALSHPRHRPPAVAQWQQVAIASDGPPGLCGFAVAARHDSIFVYGGSAGGQPQSVRGRRRCGRVAAIVLLNACRWQDFWTFDVSRRTWTRYVVLRQCPRHSSITNDPVRRCRGIVSSPLRERAYVQAASRFCALTHRRPDDAESGRARCCATSSLPSAVSAAHRTGGR